MVSTPPFAWASGGCARVVYEESRALSAKGHRVTILTTDLFEHSRRYPISINPQIIEKIEIYRLKNLSRKLAWKYKLYIVPDIIRFLHRRISEFDVVHLHDLLSPNAILTSRYCIKKHIPYILTIHGSGRWLLSDDIFKKSITKIFLNRILQNACKVTALNSTEVYQYREFGVDKDKIIVVPNGINLKEYDEIPKRGGFRRRFGLDDNENLILYLGRIHESKGLEILMEAFNLIKQENNDARLVICGPDDGYLTRLNKLAIRMNLLDRIIFPGFLTENMKKLALIDADAFVTPIFYGFPITFLESWACGTSIVTTNKGDNIDWINEKVGIVAEYDPIAIKDALMRIINDKEVKQRFRMNAKEMLEKELNWDVISKQLEEIYEECIRDYS